MDVSYGESFEKVPLRARDQNKDSISVSAFLSSKHCPSVLSPASTSLHANSHDEVRRTSLHSQILASGTPGAVGS